MSKKKRKFFVTISRAEYRGHTFEVAADSAKEAEALAHKEAGNFEFSSGEADYETTHIEEVE